MEKVVVNGVEYSYQLDMGALLRFETFFERVPEELRTPRRSELVLHYACLLHDANFGITFDEFVASIVSKEQYDALTAAGEAEQKRWSAKNNGIEAKAEDTPQGEEKKK